MVVVVVAAAAVVHPRRYYMGALTLVSLERTNLPCVSPRVYMTATGNGAWADGSGMATSGIGGAVEWFWDTSLRSQVIAELNL